jgi:hypothetical protein
MAKITRQVGALVGAAVATFLLLWGGTAAARITHVIAPMRQGILRVPGVESVHTATNPVTGATVIRIRLGPVHDLMTTLDAIRADIPPDLGPYQLDLQDRPDAMLTRLTHQDAFIVEEGLATGQYVPMEQHLLAAGQAAHVRTVVDIDANAVYLSLFAGRNYMYTVFQKGGLSE